MSTDTIVNIAAKTDKAGRHANQDNFLLIPDVGNVGGHNPDDVNRDRQVIIPKRGTLLVVADGMGGMNAGEVASQTIVTSLRTSFSDVPDKVFASDGSIVDFIDEAINAADMEVKAYARKHREARGLGSTIVLAWFLDDKVYCAWCGDSRIYCYNPAKGLERISHDHSYVQTLVDAGSITEEEAFSHPDSNIITRSIGDNDEIVRPDSRIVKLREGDTWLLCSDGLCGLLNDAQIESIIAQNPESSLTTLRSLWLTGETTGWTDNCTILLLSVLELGTAPQSAPTTSAVDESAPEPTRQAPVTTPYEARPPRSHFGQTGQKLQPIGNKRMLPTIIATVLLLIAVGAAAWWFLIRQKDDNVTKEQLKDKIETISTSREENEQAAAPVQPQPAPAATPQRRPAKPNNTPQSQSQPQPEKSDAPVAAESQEAAETVNDEANAGATTPSITTSIKNQYNKNPENSSDK